MVSSTKSKIAILGATGYIGKSLAFEFAQNYDFELVLFSREINKLAKIMETTQVSLPNRFSLRELKNFNDDEYDVVINATGIGNTALQRENPSLIFLLTEEIDNLIIDYLHKKPDTKYINLSSGAVFGSGFTQAITETTPSSININALKAAEYYSVAKLNAEAKHRALVGLQIVDLRVYAFFSCFVDTKTEFLMSEIVSCLKNKSVFKTSPIDIVRDYITPKDLANLIDCVIKATPLNDAFDVYSLGSVTKFELLSYISNTYGLLYEVGDAAGIKAGFSKNVYLSENKKAESLGYVPTFSSLTGIGNELEKMSKSNLL